MPDNIMKMSFNQLQGAAITKLLPKGYSLQLASSKKSDTAGSSTKNSHLINREGFFSQGGAMNEWKGQTNHEQQQHHRQGRSRYHQQESYSRQKPVKYVFNLCQQLIKKLKKHPSSVAFRVPVNTVVLGIPEYQDVIFEPMDLRTMEDRLYEGFYDAESDIHLDIHKILMNSYKFNADNPDLIQITKEFEVCYRKSLKQVKLYLSQKDSIDHQFTTIYPHKSQSHLSNKPMGKKTQHKHPHGDKATKNGGQESYHLDDDDQSENDAQLQRQFGAFLKKLSLIHFPRLYRDRCVNWIPKADKNITMNEKKAIKGAIQGLCDDDLTNVVEILRRAKKLKGMTPDEVEVDLDKMENKTLREIQNFLFLRSTNMLTLPIEADLKKEPQSNEDINRSNVNSIYTHNVNSIYTQQQQNPNSYSQFRMGPDENALRKATTTTTKPEKYKLNAHEVLGQAPNIFEYRCNEEM